MSKYHNEPIVIDGIRFDSKREAHRYQELRWMLRAGLITELERQVPFVVVPPQKTPKGQKVQPVKYIADFVYKDKYGMKVVEDAKGVRTQGYTIKKKLMLWVHGIEIQEV